MKKLLAVVVTGLFMFGLAGAADATIIKDGNEWLEFSYTAGYSRDFVEANLLGTAGFEGYRYASRAETASLLDSYFTGNLTDFDTGYRPETWAAAYSFLNDFGALQRYEYGYIDNFSWFDYGTDAETVQRDAFTYTGRVGVYKSPAGPEYGWFDARHGSDASNPNIILNQDYLGQTYTAGLLIYSPPGSVPEPATMLLFGTGLAGLAALRRRKKA